MARGAVVRGVGWRGRGWGGTLRGILVVGLLGWGMGDERSQRYQEGEEVKVWVNKVGPFENPQETYPYYALPFCKIDASKMERRWSGLGEALEGNSLVQSDYAVQFKKDLAKIKVCSKKLDARAVMMFDAAVRNNYWYNMVLDELPMWAMVGEKLEPNATSDGGHLVYTHKHFSIAYHGDRVIEVNITSEQPSGLKEGANLDFSYSVTWVPTTKHFAQRFLRYLDQDFFEHQIHWFSIFNSFMMVIFLVGLVALILLRTLKNDYQRYARALDDEDPVGGDPGDETGWKQVQGDVFRFPPYFPFFCALIGTGIQLIVMVYFTTLLSILGTLYVGRGAVSSTAVIVFALSSFVSGYTSGSHYVESRGNAWIKTMLLSAIGFSGFSVAIVLTLNSVAIAYSSLAAIPFGTMVIVLLIWALISCPLTLLGTIVGRNLTKPYSSPCRVTQIPRQIPDKRWFMSPWIVIPLGGLLPFGSIFIEMYFIFTSFWNYKFYYVYGFILLVFTILIIVTVCVSIVITYFNLNAEDWRWPWTSFLSGASISIYVFVYSIYYFLVKTKMYGLLQTCFYFGNISIVCAALAIVCGSVGYLGARTFVWRIYSNVKTD